MAVSVGTFRTDFPEFADETNYPPGQVTFWLGIAAKIVNDQRWSELTPLGIELFAAHNLTLGFMDRASSDFGGAPGATPGAVQSKSVDKVSVSYDTASSAELDAGHWNITSYGKRFIRFAKIVGAGPVQVNIGTSPSYSGGAWPGPFYPWG